MHLLAATRISNGPLLLDIFSFTLKMSRTPDPRALQLLNIKSVVISFRRKDVVKLAILLTMRLCSGHHTTSSISSPGRHFSLVSVLQTPVFLHRIRFVSSQEPPVSPNGCFLCLR